MTQLIFWLNVVSILPPFQGDRENSAVFAAHAAWNERIRQTDGWTGGDGCHSIDLGSGKSLWLFADSWIGQIEGGVASGQRKTMRMVNQAAGVVDSATGRFEFLIPPNEAKGFWKPDDPAGKEWYWPGDAVRHDGKLWIFLHRLAPKPDGDPGFAFRQVGTDLFVVEEPPSEKNWTAEWLSQAKRVGATQTKGPFLGSAAAVEGPYLYGFTQIDLPKPKPFTRPMGVARLPLAKLSTLSPTDPIPWEFQGKDGKWGTDPSQSAVVIEDGAPEMSLRKVPGISGWVLVYMQLGMGDRAMARRAPSLEGPWTKSRLIGRTAPDAEAKRDGIFSYAVKIHPEVQIEPGRVNPPGQFLLTWASNSGDLGVHKRRPDLYFPRFTVADLGEK